MVEAERLKDEGNELFSRQKFNEAIQKYNKGCEILEKEGQKSLNGESMNLYLKLRNNKNLCLIRT